MKFYKNIFNSTKSIDTRFFIGILLFYRLSLDFIYWNVISPLYEFQNFIADFSIPVFAYSLFWFVIIVFYDLKLYKDERPSSLLMLFTDFFFFIPLTSICGLANFKPSFVLFGFIFWIIMSYFQLREIKKVHWNYTESNIKLNNVFLVIIWSIIVINVFATVNYNGFQIKLNLEDVYDLRSEQKESGMPLVLWYIKPWASILVLVLLIIYILKKKYIYVALLCIIQLMNFAFGAMKGDFFSLFVALLIGFTYKPSRKYLLLYSIIFLNIVVLVEYLVYKNSVVSIYIHRRMMYMPSLLSAEYYDFF